MATDHVLITLSDFKQICSDLKRTGDLIKGVVRATNQARKRKHKNVQPKKIRKEKRKPPSGDESESNSKSRRSKSPTKRESDPVSPQSDTDSSALSFDD